MTSLAIIGSKKLGLCGQMRVRFVILLGLCRAVDEQAGGLDIRLHVRKLELCILERADGFTELNALSDILDALLNGALGNAQGLSGDADAAAVQRHHGDLEALVHFAQQVFLRDDHILKNQLPWWRRARIPIFFSWAPTLKPGKSFSTIKAEMPLLP